MAEATARAARQPRNQETKASSSDAPFKTRFMAKRLQNFFEEKLSEKKKEIIQKHCFADMSRIARFNVPDELLEWVVMNIDPKLREYRHKLFKPIFFTRDMMQKVFNLPSGERPVSLLKKSEHTNLRNMYRDGDHPSARAPIPFLEELLRKCPDDDIVMINRSFDLLCFATVLFPGTSNMVPLDYLGSLLDMDRVHEYAWDEEVLRFCMDQVAEFQSKRNYQKDHPELPFKQFNIGSCLPALVVIYVDHLDFPPLSPTTHIMDYSLPRACNVCNADFDLAVAIDKNKKTLAPDVFGRRPIRDLRDTPYAIVQHDGAHQHVQPPQAHLIGSDDANENGSASFAEPCATLADWLSNSLPSSQELGVPPQYQLLYDKHKRLFESEMKGVLHSFGRTVQLKQCTRMALLLKDLSSADTNVDGTEATNEISFAGPKCDPTADGSSGLQEGPVVYSEVAVNVAEKGVAAHKVAKVNSAHKVAKVNVPEKVDKVVAAHKVHKVVAAENVDKDVAAENVVLSNVAAATDFADKAGSSNNSWLPPSPPRSPRSGPTWDAALQAAPDAPSMDLYGSQELEFLNGIATSPANSARSLPTPGSQPHGASPPTPANSAGPTAPGLQQEYVDASSGPSTHQKKTRHKRVAKDFESVQRMKKLKIDPDGDAIYTKYVLHKHKTRKPKDGDCYPPVIKIGGFYTSYQNWQSCLKPRAYMDNEIMSLWIEHVNLSNQKSRKCKKFAFSGLFTVIILSKLSGDPTKFKSKSCMAEFKIACKDGKASKSDLWYFTILQDNHWILCTVNLLHKQINVFDSTKSSNTSASLLQTVDNIIANLTTLVNDSKCLDADISSFRRVVPKEYPRQSTNYDCGFFVMLYMENWDGKIMKIFDQECVSTFRKIVAATLFLHEHNEIDAAAAIAEQVP